MTKEDVVKIGKTIGFTTEEGPRWAFVILKEENGALFDKHKADKQLKIVQKGDELTVKFNVQAAVEDAELDTGHLSDDVKAKDFQEIGRIVDISTTKYTEDEIADLCREHGILTGVQGLRDDKVDLTDQDDEKNKDPHGESTVSTGEVNDGPDCGPG